MNVRTTSVSRTPSRDRRGGRQLLVFSESIAFKSVVAFTAVEVVRRDQHAIAGNDHNTSLVQSSAEVFADLIELTHEVFNLLFAEHELLAVADAVAEG